MAMPSFEELVENHATAHEFAAWFRGVPDSGPLSEDEWRQLVFPVVKAAGGFDWLSPRDKGWVEACLLEFARKAFTKLRARGEHDYRIPAELTGFAEWLKLLPDQAVVHFCWDLVKSDHFPMPDPVLWLHWSRRLAGEISLQNIELAVSLDGESERMQRWPEGRWSVARWERDSSPYIQLISHSSYLVRGAAGYALGSVYKGTATKNAPPISDVLAMVQRMEIVNPGIAGPFIEGASFLEEFEWNERAEGFDARTWFLETLRRSAREPQLPHLISLEFFAHEFFRADAEAIREMLRMGRRHLAVMSATEEPRVIPQLLPVLEEMAASTDPEVSAAIKTYLADPSTHAGLHHLSDSTQS
jgi:hypothetical protein